MMKRNRTLVKRLRFIPMIGMLMLLSYKGFGQSTFVVTTTNDPVNPALTVVGELRWAVNQANNAVGPSLISFNIPGTGPFTFNLKSTLPTVVKPTFIDGTTQPGYNFNDPGNPMIILDGTINSWSQLDHGIALNNAPGSKITGLYLRRFLVGISVTSSNYCEITNNTINSITGYSLHLFTSSFGVIKGNYINTDKNLTMFLPRSAEGVFINHSHDNIIGGTSCGEANTIAYVTSEGIDNYPVPGQRNQYSGNILFGNDEAFFPNSPNYDILLRGGNGGKPYPTIVTTGCTVSGTSQAYDIIQLFGSSGPNSYDPTSTRVNANVYMGSVKADVSGNWSMPVSDIKYPYVIATATDAFNNTSELCPRVAIVKDTLKLIISNPTPCVGEEVIFENSASLCKAGLNFIWDFGDGSPPSATSNHIYTTAGTYTVTVSVPEANNCPAKIGSKVVYVQCIQKSCETVIDCSSLAAFVSGPVVSGPNLEFTGGFSGGIPPYSFMWSSDQLTLSNITSLTVTVHPPISWFILRFTVTDGNGCVTWYDYYNVH